MTEHTYKERFVSFIKKVRAVKHIEIILALIAAAIVLLVYGFVSSAKNNAPSDADSDTSAVTSTTMTEDAERRLTDILSEINGAGEVSVMISFASGVETVYATTNSTTVNNSTGSGGGSSLQTATETPVIVTNDGKSTLIKVKEVMPEIVGVVVVAQGASDIKIRLALLAATATALDLDPNKIEVFTKK